MRTTETEGSGGGKKAGLVPAREYWQKRRRGPRLREQPLWVPGDVGSYQDPIAQAVARERESRRVAMPECETVLDHVFQCVCCGRVRSDEERRDARSEVCLRCVEDAGFWN